MSTMIRTVFKHLKFFQTLKYYFGNNLSIIASPFFSIIACKSVCLYEQELLIFSCRSNNILPIKRI